jgi:hypothetical protein
LKISVEMSEDEFYKSFGKVSQYESSRLFDMTVGFSSERVCMTGYTTHTIESVDDSWGCERIVTVHMESVRVVKSPQEIAAEESVRKAESALQAAKDVLGKVKGV